jgi:hypothetical protein
VVGRVKQSVLFNRLLYRAPKTSEGEEKSTIPPDVAAVWAENTRQLAEMLDRPLPDSWHG